MEGAGLKRGVDGNGGYGIEVVGVPVGCKKFVAHFVHCRSERALSKSNTIVGKLCPNHVQVAQVLTHFCIAPLLDYLAASLPPDVVREALKRFDEGVLAGIAPAVLSAEVVNDPLLRYRLRQPARLNGGALRARGGWLADAAYVATLIRVLPTMVDHKVEGAKQGAPEEHEVGFLHEHMVFIVGNMEDSEEGRWAHLCDSGTQLGTTFFAAWENVRDAAGNPNTGPLSDEPEHAGRKFEPKEAMRWGGENASAPGPEDPDDKVKEQKQITMEIEDHLDVPLK